MNDAQIIKAWCKSPLKYIEDVWGLVPQPLVAKKPDLPEAEYRPEDFKPFQHGKHLTWQQWLYFRAIQWAITGKAPPFITVKSGHGTGKSSSESLTIWWGLTCFLDSQIAATAPTADQLFDVLWKEAAKWHRKMPPELADCFELQTHYIRVKERAETWWARARTARKENPEALAGLHGDTVIILVDEASGVPEQIFEVAQGALTGKFVLFIMVSNPTRLSGYFYDSHNKHKTKWQRLHFSSEDSPIVDHEYIKRIAETYGRESPQYSVRVLGEFPEAEENQLISRKLFDQSAARPRVRDPNYCRCLGVDVAYKGGDRTALVERQGNMIEVRRVRMDQDTVATANDAMQEINIAKKEGNPYDFVMVDVIGYGAGVYDTLKERQKNGEIAKATRIIGVNVAETAEEEAEYKNKRVELWHRYKKMLETGAVDPQLKEDSIGQKYDIPDSRGRWVLVAKDKIREETGQSPDLADAAVITFVVGNLRRKSKNELFAGAMKMMQAKENAKRMGGWQGKLAGMR